MSIWISWKDLKSKVYDRDRLIFFGKSPDWLPKAIEKLGTPSFIIDSNTSLTGMSELGVEVVNLSVLDNLRPGKDIIVITSGSYESILDTLKETDLTEGQDIFCTPEYYDVNKSQSLKVDTFDFLFTSPDYPRTGQYKRSSKSGGGLYKGKISDGNIAYEKLLSGQFRQLERFDNKYFAVNGGDKYIAVINNDTLELEERIPLELEHACGLTICEKRDWLIVSDAYNDQLAVYKLDSYEQVNLVNILKFSSSEGRSLHHINDLAVHGDKLFISCFSISGYWKSGMYDGGVIAVDLDSLNQKSLDRLSYDILCNDLFMPHSVKVFDTTIHFLESAAGKLFSGSHKSDIELPGFLRGIEERDGKYLLGLSETQYISRFKNLKPYIMMNCGIYSYDKSDSVVRFYALPDFVGIHDIMLL